MAIDTLRLAQGNNISDTLSSSIGSSDLTIPVNTISIWSSTGGKVIIDRGLSTQEIIYCTGVSGSSLVVQSGGRGLENTTAQGHNVGATIESVPTAGDWSDLVNAVKNVLTTSTGALDTTKVTDLTTAQTLTNKTITDSTNNVMAKSLKSATTTVDVSAATAPSANQVLTATDSTHATWQTPAALSSTNSLVTNADFTTSSTTYVDVTSASVTITVGSSGKVLFYFKGSTKNSSTDQSAVYAYKVDSGSDVDTLYTDNDQASANRVMNNSFTIIITGLSAGSHTIKLRCKATGGTVTLLGTTYGYEVGALAL